MNSGNEEFWPVEQYSWMDSSSQKEIRENSQEYTSLDKVEFHRKPHLEIYDDASILVGENEYVRVIWYEGKQSKNAQARYEKITRAFKEGFLQKKIEEGKSPTEAIIFEAKLTGSQRQALEKIVDSISAQEGRALVDILILQLSIKVIVPDQDVRLHKGSKGKSDQSREKLGNKGNSISQSQNKRTTFSWSQGISMRSLDTNYIIPTLREYDLLRMNQYGAFMTRSFAENYPYTQFYKAEITGAKNYWLEILDELERSSLDANAALLYVLELLWKSSEKFKQLAGETIKKLEVWLLQGRGRSLKEITEIIKLHINQSEACARLLEVAIHSLLQALEDVGSDFEGTLKPLMPMRTANLKHGNIGDIEIIVGDSVIEAWDAKYATPYLSDALDELVDKIRNRNVSELTFGYVLLPEKKEYAEVDRKIAAIEDEFGVVIQVMTLDEWADWQLERTQIENIPEEQLAMAWLRAYAESLALYRRKKAPIDEPTYDWLLSLINLFTLK